MRERLDGRMLGLELNDMLRVMLKESAKGLDAVLFYTDRDSKKGPGAQINTREYSLPKVLRNTETALKWYVNQCDRLSLRTEKGESYRKYLVRPYMGYRPMELLFSLLEDVEIYLDSKLQDPTLSREKATHSQKMLDTVHKIYDTLEETDFCTDTDESVSYWRE